MAAARPAAATAATATATALLVLVLVLLLAAAATGQQQDEGPAAWEARAGQLRAAAAAHPRDFQTALDLATTLHQLDHAAPNGGKRVPEAAAAYRRAAELAAHPEMRALVLGNLGALMLSGGRVVEAGEVMNATLALAEGLGLQKSDMYVGLLFNLAKAEQQLGRQERSQALMGQVLQQAKGVAGAGASYLKAWAALKAFTPQQVAEMEECARYLRRSRRGVEESGMSADQLRAWRSLRERWAWLDGVPLADQAWVAYGLFAAHQQAGQYDEAWAALHEGNQLQEAAARASGQPYDPRQDDLNTAAVVRMFQPPKPGSSSPADAFYAALMRGEGGYQDPAPGLRPIFVVGMPRSGSTLIEQILASHSQVWGAGEDTALAPLLPDLLAVLQGGGEVEAARIAAVGGRYIQEMRGRLPPERAGARWFVDKMLRNAWNLGFIAMMLSDACLIHAARHPADTALSCYAQPFEGRGTPWASNLTSIAHQVQLVQQLMDHWERVLPGRVLQVRYCDLVRDQEATTRRMLAHCGIPWEQSVLSFHQTQRTVSTASLAQVRQKLYSGSMLRFRRYARHLAPLLRPLRQLILRYESEASLDSSEQLLAEVLDTSSAGESSGSGSRGAARVSHGQQQQEQEQQQEARGGGAAAADGSSSQKGSGRGDREEL